MGRFVSRIFSCIIFKVISADLMILTVKNLVKNYGNFTAVNGISFEVNDGEIFGFLGPNGAGKTTTLEVIETLLPKTSGEVVVCGHNIDKNAAKIKSLIGVQLQSSSFPASLNLIEILDLFSALYGTRIKPIELLEKVQLADKKNSKVKQLSGGQRQRFSLATTLVNSPKLIFLDEPSTGLDPQARHNLWALIKDIQKNGTTVVITTHFMDEAERLCDRVAIMDQGKILKIDSPDTLIDELVKGGFTKSIINKGANLEDVFLNFTGKHLRD